MNCGVLAFQFTAMTTWASCLHHVNSRQLVDTGRAVRTRADNLRFDKSGLGQQSRQSSGLGVEQDCRHLRVPSVMLEALDGTGDTAVLRAPGNPDAVGLRRDAPFVTEAGDWRQRSLTSWREVITEKPALIQKGTRSSGFSATAHPLPSDSATAFVTDPPVLRRCSLRRLIGFFYVWLRRSVGELYPDLFAEPRCTEGRRDCEMADRTRPDTLKDWNRVLRESQMGQHMAEGRRVLIRRNRSRCLCHKSTADGRRISRR